MGAGVRALLLPLLVAVGVVEPVEPAEEGSVSWWKALLFRLLRL
jgi:hypothetical protein